MILVILCLLIPSAFVAWRYAVSDTDPDQALFMLPRFTGSWYGRDFADCKTPGIYLWYYGLSLLVGKSIERVKFANTFLVGFGGGMAIFLLTGDFWKALAFSTLVNSGFLYAFHGNVGQVPAMLVVCALCISNPWVACALVFAATLFEPKYVLSLVAMALIYGWVIPLGVFSTLAVITLLAIRKTVLFQWIWESSVEIPALMLKYRLKGAAYHRWVPSFMAIPLITVLPWVALSVWGKPDVLFWVPPLLYMLLIGKGQAVRPNHFLPLIPWIVVGQTNPTWVFSLTLIMWLSAGFYLGNIWNRFYPGLEESVRECRKVGLALCKEVGSIWVNGLFSACVYLYAQKPVPYGMTEQVEIREVVKHRRERMIKRWKLSPSKYVVETPEPEIQFSPKGYKLLWQTQLITLYKRQEA